MGRAAWRRLRALSSAGGEGDARSDASARRRGGTALGLVNSEKDAPPSRALRALMRASESAAAVDADPRAGMRASRGGRRRRRRSRRRENRRRGIARARLVGSGGRAASGARGVRVTGICGLGEERSGRGRAASAAGRRGRDRRMRGSASDPRGDRGGGAPRSQLMRMRDERRGRRRASRRPRTRASSLDHARPDFIRLRVVARVAHRIRTACVPPDASGRRRRFNAQRATSRPRGIDRGVDFDAFYDDEHMASVLGTREHRPTARSISRRSPRQAHVNAFGAAARRDRRLPRRRGNRRSPRRGGDDR